MKTIRATKGLSKGTSMHNAHNQEARPGGFTLIELVVTLILVGIMATVGGFGIVQAIQGYMLTRDNAELSQKAQLAMTRINREIVEMTGFWANADATSLPVTNVQRDVILGLDSGTIRISPRGTALSAGDILVDNVNSFALAYWQGGTAWTNSDDIRLLSSIDVTLTMNRRGGGTMVFANRTNPRNNKNLGGAPPPSASDPAFSNHPLCFVATAAYGNAAHPVVLLLQEFRDRFLLTWSGGRWLVEQYYAHGPTAAAMVQGRPLAVWAVKCMLFPVAALTFLVVYAPLLFSALLAFLALAALAVFHARHKIKGASHMSLSDQKGGILIGMIAAMLIIGVLGAAMTPMFSSSIMNQAFSDHGRKAYFLAEAGFRSAAGAYIAAGSSETARKAVLADLNNKTAELSGNQGSFSTVVYPFWSQATDFSGTDLETSISGSIPNELNTGTGGHIRVGSDFFSYTSRDGSGTTVTYSGLSGTPTINISNPPDVLPAARPSSGSQTVNEGGSLSLNALGADAFPPLNGNFTLPNHTALLPGTIFNYEKRNGTTLSNITLADSEATWASFSVNDTNYVVLEKFLRLASTGNYSGTTREILYSVPLGWVPDGSEFQKEQYHDRFNSPANWFVDNSLGGHQVSGGAMQVTGTISPGQTPSNLANWLGGLLGWIQNHGRFAAVAFNWGNVNTNLAKAWHDAGGNLSYDIQVKVNNNQPYFFAGLGFRMRNNSGTGNNQDLYTYGVSFVRQRQAKQQMRALFGSSYSWNESTFSFLDDINNALRPPYVTWTAPDNAGVTHSSLDFSSTYSCGFFGVRTCRDAYRYSEPAITLWQRNGPPNLLGVFKILGYRIITSGDNLTTGTGKDLVLKPWSTLMVRLVEGHELPFTFGRVDGGGRHIKYGDYIRNESGTKTARVIGTPIMTTAWGANNTTSGQGTLILTNLPDTPFSSGEDLFLVGGDGASAYARASGAQAAAKASYIMVYFTSPDSGTGNLFQADNARTGLPRDAAQWPPDDWTDRAADKDFFTLIGGETAAIRWTNLDTTADGQGNVASFVPALATSDFYQAVIKTSALVSPAWTSASTASDFTPPGDHIALITSSSAATSTSYDDFAIQLDMKAGTGFLPPIQQ